MQRLIRKTLLAYAIGFQIRLNKNIIALILGSLFLIFSTSTYAASPVKPLSNKVLKTIEEKYDKQTRKIVSGKNSEKNVLALKRLLAADVNPDLAIAAVKKYAEARSYRSGSIQRRNAYTEIETLFANSNIDSKQGRDIMIKAGSSISARKCKTMQQTSHNANKPSCRSKKTVTKKATKVKHQDPDRLAESILLSELKGKTKNKVFASL